jgi:glycosyltransferase involved in cell wall biosynthesis
MSPPPNAPTAARPLRIAYLATGAAGMYCGSCIRDNRVAATLLAQGRDVFLLPLYTPLKTDEPDVSRDVVYYGGINVYLEQRFRFFRRLPAAMTRILDAPGLLRRVMRWSGKVRPEDLGALAVSVLRGEHGPQKPELDKLIEALRQLRPSLVQLPNLPLIGIAPALRRELGVPVLCTLSGEDIFLDALAEPYRDQAFRLIRDAARHVQAFISVTSYYADFAAQHFALPRERIHVVPMGIAWQDFDGPADRPERPFQIGFLARICEAKGLHHLCDALVHLRREGRDCRVIAAGYLAAADKPYLIRVLNSLEQAGVADSFQYLGEITREQKVALLRSVHAFSVPTVYHEAKGLPVIEALAAGTPVVQPAHGSFPELIEATRGGLLYDPGDPAATRRLAESIARLMDNPALREELGRQGQRGVRERFSDEVMAAQTWALYERYCTADSS